VSVPTVAVERTHWKPTASVTTVPEGVPEARKL